MRADLENYGIREVRSGKWEVRSGKWEVGNECGALLMIAPGDWQIPRPPPQDLRGFKNLGGLNLLLTGDGQSPGIWQGFPVLCFLVDSGLKQFAQSIQHSGIIRLIRDLPDKLDDRIITQLCGLLIESPGFHVAYGRVQRGNR